MPHSPSHRRLGATPTFALACAAVVVVGLLALSGAARAATRVTAHARKASCTGASRHVKHQAGECAQSKHKGKARHSSARHRAGHPTKSTGAASPTSVSHAPSVCEDASAPVRGADGSFSCEDGSEPACQDGSEPSHSSKATALLCPGPGNGEGGCEDASGECAFGGSGAEPACEDARTPVPDSDGADFCEDGSEPVCEDGTSPTFSADGSTPLCEAASSGSDEGGD